MDLKVLEELGEWQEYVTWTSDNPAVAAVAWEPDSGTRGTVTSVAQGTAWITASLDTGDGMLSARCRVDVMPDPISGIDGVRLPVQKATVELYRTDLTEIPIELVLDQNAVNPDGEDSRDLIPISPPWAITSAAFVDDKTAEVFYLGVKDDRTLVIVPTVDLSDDAAVKAVRGSYKSKIRVNIATGVESMTLHLKTEPLTISVKKSTPKLKAAAVKLNSFIPIAGNKGDTQPIVVTGGTVTDLWPDVDPDSWKDVDDPAILIGPVYESGDWTRYGSDPCTYVYSDWALLDGFDLSYIGDADAKYSAKLNLRAEVEGWALDWPVTVSVSAAPTAPKLSVKPASVSLQPGTWDFVTVAATVTPAAFADPDDWGITVGTITGDIDYDENYFSVVPDGRTLRVMSGRGFPADGRAHTFKVNLSVGGQKPVVLTVKLMAPESYKLTAKAVGAIDLAVPGSPVEIVPTLKNYSGMVRCDITGITDAAGDDASASFEVYGLQITAAGDPAPGTYTATLTANLGARTTDVQVKFTVKRSAKAPAASVTLKAKGAIDVIRPGSAVTLTPTLKNLYGWDLRPDDVEIVKTYDGATKQKCSETVTNQFAVSMDDEGEAYVISVKGVVSHLDKYTVTATIGGCESKAVNLTVKMGGAKIAQSAKAVTLLRDDRNDRAVITLTPQAGLSRIARVAFESPKDKTKRDAFELIPLVTGGYVIAFNGNELPAEGFKGGTAKLKVFLEGNLSDKPNATLSVKINLG